MPATSHRSSAQINYVLPSDLIPFPKRQTAQQRKSKKQRSEILTSSPYKSQLEQNEATKRKIDCERAKKQLAKQMKMQKIPGTSQKKLKRTNQIGSRKRIDQPSTSTKKIICPPCNKEYIDPPEEDWIQCDSCKEWWHDACSNYEGQGNFICDYC